MNILTINAGSSSIKYKIFTLSAEEQQVILSGLIEGIGEVSSQWHHQFKHKNKTIKHFSNHKEAFAALAQQLYDDLGNFPIMGVGHRVVHGGSELFKPTIINAEVLQAIKELSNLAPIHNPINAQGIEFAQQYFPKAIHIAIFDSGFHHSMPEYVARYAIETATAQRLQIRRYGFHGINHEYVAEQAALFLNKPLHDCCFISLHLGNGASACLIKQGESFDTSMGMTPLAGLIMGTRCGDIDPAIVLYLIEQGMTAHQIDQLLNKKSGLRGIANENDMRKILERYEQGDIEAKEAIAMYVYSIQKTIGAYLSQTEKLDALIFTGGVGENAATIREKIIKPLQHLGFHLNDEYNQQKSDLSVRRISSHQTPILVIRGDEESLIAHKVAQILPITH